MNKDVPCSHALDVRIAVGDGADPAGGRPAPGSRGPGRRHGHGHGGYAAIWEVDELEDAPALAWYGSV